MALEREAQRVQHLRGERKDVLPMRKYMAAFYEIGNSALSSQRIKPKFLGGNYGGSG